VQFKTGTQSLKLAYYLMKFWTTTEHRPHRQWKSPIRLLDLIQTLAQQLFAPVGGRREDEQPRLEGGAFPSR
jgi:hypothetical protein